MKHLGWVLLLVTLATAAEAEDTGRNAVDETEQAAATETDEPAGSETDGSDPNAPKTLSGMSILGNEEAPKSLVIIPWKSSEIGSDIGLDDSLDERAEPVDREVFLRELEFYEIRSGD
ncbi:MAG: hypothetical protein ACR2QX_05610 [Woeseiaceae bacterium]